MRQVVSATEISDPIHIDSLHAQYYSRSTYPISVNSYGIIIAHNNAQLKVKGDYITY